jgi:hypothetical protein
VQEQQLPDPPRELNSVIRRRTWTEPRVRLWWVLSLGVLLVTLYIVGSQLATWLSEKRLIDHGTPVEATIDAAHAAVVGNVTKGRPMPADSEAELSFDWKSSRQKVRGQLPEFIEQKRNVIVGQTVTLHVDPDDPGNWTSRTRPAPLLSRQLIGVSVGLPVVAVLGALAVLKQRRLAEVFRNGPAASAMVVGTGQSAVAPRAKAIRCTPAESNDKRVFTVYLPAGAGPVAPGDVLTVIRPSQRPEPAYAVAWFARGGT